MRRIKRYKTENSKTVLELNIANLEQLFDKRDPNPYRSKDLDDDIVEYLVSSAQEVGYRSLGAIEIITQIEMTKEEHQDLDVAIREFFLYREEITLKQLRTTFVLGLKTLVIGSTFLSLAIVLPVMIENTWASEFVDKFLREGLLLVGWVSMWKPVNIFLYEWWPLADLAKVFRKLSSLPLRFDSID